ncbi:PREDICTED: protein ROOT PRIMORDIUM DEFECTIVE 1 [Nelumbo nucifera]|uniref:Protein ROOT PRIMORDIUM DEFECTIVE 1 n=2 Tax=Nelumbo nucifera TaxID=4432 RepID=A0A1U8ALT4_NELNU|nr:PREDICTED: protein ROOT PRIMORDIUM DEFECTIVE 1 [Nelumbo nucifera]DAD25355.1 TPA_asm: hypothetical protein HUJ06_026819 [Nelumbo nucifera]
MALSNFISSPKHKTIPSLPTSFLPPKPSSLRPHRNPKTRTKNNNLSTSISLSSSSIKIVRNPSLDKHVVKSNKLRFVQKLKTLLLSKPKHYIPLHILTKCRSYLSLPPPRSLLSMIHRYPSIFQLFTLPNPPTSLSRSDSQLCVRLTPAAAALATQESHLKSSISATLANKLQKLLMLSSHRRLLLYKLAHLGPDLGFPPNFRSRLCNEHPDRFKTVDTSYGRALELVSWNSNLAVPIASPDTRPRDLIVDRPLKFKQLRLRKGLNLKKRHREFLIKFGELPEVSPYSTPVGVLMPESIEAEKRACAVVREVLGMTVEKRTLIDHLTHFRKEFGLPNKLRAMLVRHPELFYVSLKGQRDSVFLVEGYDEKGELLEKDELLVTKERLMELVREGKRMRRERRKGGVTVIDDEDDNEQYTDNDGDDDGFDNLVEEEWEDFGIEDGVNDSNGEVWDVEEGKFWVVAGSSAVNVNDQGGARSMESW